MSDPDWAPMVALMKEAREKSRGYASYWEWPIDRSMEELQVARVLRNYLAIVEPADWGLVERVSDDPPDAVIVKGSQRIGVEVTELVDSKTVERHRHRGRLGKAVAYDWAKWTASLAAQAISAAVVNKDRKLAKATCRFDELAVAIFTDEPLINTSLVRTALNMAPLVVSQISRAFLILGYSPGADQAEFPDLCPVFPIPLFQTSPEAEP